VKWKAVVNCGRWRKDKSKGIRLRSENEKGCERGSEKDEGRSNDFNLLKCLKQYPRTVKIDNKVNIS
jgi:hypothetical protein